MTKYRIIIKSESPTGAVQPEAMTMRMSADEHVYDNSFDFRAGNNKYSRLAMGNIADSKAGGSNRCRNIRRFYPAAPGPLVSGVYIHGNDNQFRSIGAGICGQTFDFYVK